jgi:prepilin peptidase CpaA
MLVFIVIFSVIVAMGFGLASAWSDFKGFTISNVYSIGVILAFVPAFLAVTLMAPEAAYFASWKSHLIAAAGVFAVTFVLFTTNMIGAGDSKLCTAYALWVGLLGLPSFLFFMTVFGGLLGLMTLIFRKWKPFKAPAEGSWIAKAQEGASEVPYGIAIVIGALIAFIQSGYFDPDALAALAQTASTAEAL